MSDPQSDKEKHESHTSPACKRTTASKIITAFLLFGFIIFVFLFIQSNFIEKIEPAKVDTTKASIIVLKNAVVTFSMNTGRIPTEEEGLKALVEKPENIENWDPEGYLITDQIPTDSWGNDFIYKLKPKSENGFVIISLGKDGKEGGKGKSMDLSSEDIN